MDMKAQPIDREKSAEFQDVKLDYPEETTSSQQRRTTPLGEFRVNTYTTDYQGHPAIAGLTGGGFVVTWTTFNQDGHNWGVFGKRYDASGVAQGDEFQVNTHYMDVQDAAAIGALSNGGF